MSTYAEFMGLYPPNQDLPENSFSDKSLPPMKLRKPSLHASIDGYTLIPVFSYIPNSPFDFINQCGCSYVQQCINIQYYDSRNYIIESKYALPVIGYRLA